MIASEILEKLVELYFVENDIVTVADDATTTIVEAAEQRKNYRYNIADWEENLGYT